MVEPLYTSLIMNGPTNLDKITAFLLDNEGIWYCTGCLSGETGVAPPSQICQLTRPLKVPRPGLEVLERQACDSCGARRICIRARPS